MQDGLLVESRACLCRNASNGRHDTYFQVEFNSQVIVFDIHQYLISSVMSTFKSQLKTHLFRTVFR